MGMVATMTGGPPVGGVRSAVYLVDLHECSVANAVLCADEELSDSCARPHTGAGRKMGDMTELALRWSLRYDDSALPPSTRIWTGRQVLVAEAIGGIARPRRSRPEPNSNAMTPWPRVRLLGASIASDHRHAPPESRRSSRVHVTDGAPAGDGYAPGDGTTVPVVLESAISPAIRS